MPNGYLAGWLDAPLATGSQSKTGAGGKPGFMLSFMSFMVAPGTAGSSAGFGMGVAASASDRRWAGFGSLRNGSGGNTRAGWAANATHSGGLYSCVTPSILFEFDHVSFDTDGVTVNWTTVDGVNQPVMPFLLLPCGRAATGAFTSPAAPGTQAVSVGFPPDFFLPFWMAGSTTDPRTAVLANVTPAMGFLTALAERYSGFREVHNAATSVSRNKAITATLASLSNTGVNTEAAFSSMDSAGPTLNWTTTTVQQRVYWAALAGLSVQVGVFDLPTSGGPFTPITGLPFLPAAILLQSAGKVASTTQDADLSWAIGAATGSSERWALWTGAADGEAAGSHNVYQGLSESKCLHIESVLGTGVLDEVDFTSFNADGSVTLNLTTASGTAKQVQYAVFGPPTIAAPLDWQAAAGMVGRIWK